MTAVPGRDGQVREEATREKTAMALQGDYFRCRFWATFSGRFLVMRASDDRHRRDRDWLLSRAAAPGLFPP